MFETQEYNPIIPWKAIIQTVSFIVVVGGAFQVWGQTQNRINELEKDLVTQNQEMKSEKISHRNDLQNAETRIRQLETNNARDNERFNLLLTMMSEMKSDIAALRQSVSDRN